MEIRNIQKTGDMHYLYLPTSWCREQGITSKSKVSIIHNSDGTLSISPEITEKKPKHLKFTISEDDPEIIHKLVVSSYIHPVSSFEISMDKEVDFTKLINQKRLISLESVEIDKKQITSEGIVTVSDPSSLLKTMARKIKNLIIIIGQNYDKNLIEKYEDEIDRSKMLIDKSVIGSLTMGKTTKLKSIELYYISIISRELERVVDRLICFDPKDQKFLDEITKPIEILQDVLHEPSKLDQELAMKFARCVSNIKTPNAKDQKTIDMSRIIANLTNISEVIMDWMVTLRIEN
ncbi:MAG: hypothetical protein AABX63_00305 [Nanoarchaeota archaeon]